MKLVNSTVTNEININHLFGRDELFKRDSDGSYYTRQSLEKREDKGGLYCIYPLFPVIVNSQKFQLLATTTTGSTILVGCENCNSSVVYKDSSSGQFDIDLPGKKIQTSLFQNSNMQLPNGKLLLNISVMTEPQNLIEKQMKANGLWGLGKKSNVGENMLKIVNEAYPSLSNSVGIYYSETYYSIRIGSLENSTKYYSPMDEFSYYEPKDNEISKYYALNPTEIKFGNLTTSKDIHTLPVKPMVFDSGEPYIKVPKSQWETVKEKVLKANVDGSLQLSITFDQTKFTLRSALIGLYQNGEYGLYFKPSDTDYWIIGTPFFRKYYTYFDNKNSKVKIARNQVDIS